MTSNSGDSPTQSLRLTLEPGRTRTLEFELTPDALAFWDRNMNWIVAPGVRPVKLGGAEIDDFDGFPAMEPPNEGFGPDFALSSSGPRNADAGRDAPATITRTRS
jgi:hypothetical protein